MLSLVLTIALATGPRIPVKIHREGGVSGAIPPVPPAPLCVTLSAADKAGAWWCLSGDGTMLAGSAVTLAPVNAPTTLPWDVCGGTGCVMETQTRLNAAPGVTNQNYATASTAAAPTGSFTTCWLGRVENTNPVSGVGNETLLSFTGAGGDGWSMYSNSSANAKGLSTFASGNPAPCNGGSNTCVDSGVTTTERITNMQCSIFNAGVQYTSCTFTQGAGATCVNAATASTAISNTARNWTVGHIDVAEGFQGMTGFFRGAFFTEKVLTTADVNRLGNAVLPPAPTAMAFSRASPRSCNNDVLLPANVPCINGISVSKEAVAIEGIAPTETTGSWNHVCTPGGIGCVSPISTANAAFAPWGMKQTDQVDIPAIGGAGVVGQTTSYVERGGFAGIAISDVLTASFDVMGVTGSGTIGIALNKGDSSPTDYVYAVCNWNSTTYTTCSITVTQTNTSSSVTIRIGSVDPTLTNSPYSVYVTDMNIKKQGGLTSYVAASIVSAPVTRAADVCTGTGC